jgi:hypothetical protein
MSRRNRAKPAKTCAYQLQVRRVDSLGHLSGEVDLSNPEDRAAAMAIVSWLQRHHRGVESDCFACGSVLPLLVSGVVLILPVPLHKAERVVTGGLCFACCSLPDPGLMARVMNTITTRMMPSAQLHVIPAGGRA